MEITGLTQFEKDILSLQTPDFLKKHKIAKQKAYDRRYQITKRLKTAGLSIEDALKLETIHESQLIKDAGRTGMKKAATKKAAIKEAAIASGDEILFTIDKNPPPLPKTAEEEKIEALEKIKSIATECPADGAIIIPAKLKSVSMKMLNNDLGSFKWKAFDIPDNPNAIRIYKKTV